VLTTDRGREQGGAVGYGALGVGTLKMRIHRAAIERIFSDTSVSLDAEDLLAIGAGLSG
jgi:hypothetical protein